MSGNETGIRVQPRQSVYLGQSGASYRDVDITDDFMFAYVMQRPDLCIGLLGYLFPGHKIQRD